MTTTLSTGEAQAELLAEQLSGRRWQRCRGTCSWLVRSLFGMLAIACGFVGLGPPSAGAQEPELELDVSIDSSCGRGLGTVTTMLANTTSLPLVAIVEVGPVVRNVLVEAGEMRDVVVTGRGNGVISVVVNAIAVGEVAIDCTGELRDNNDRLSSSELAVWIDQVEESIAYLAPGIGRTRSTEPGEPNGCTTDGGTVWFRVPAPGDSIEVEVANASRVSVYRSDVAAPGFDDLVPAVCVEGGQSVSIETTPGEVLVFQISGRARPSALLRTAAGRPAGIEVVDFSHRCISSGGVVDMAVRNTTSEDVRIQLQAVPRRGPFAAPGRTVTVAAGEVGRTLVSSRSDGRYQLHLNGIDTGLPVWVGCGATAANDTIATAAEVDFVDQFAQVEIGPGSYSYSRDEMARYGMEFSRCGDSRRVGSAWFTFIADAEQLSIDGSDDQDIGVWRAVGPNPTTLDDLEELSCGEAERRAPIELVLGERYWMSSMSDSLDVRLTLAPGPANDDLADAAPLEEVEVLDARGATTEPGEPADCAGDRTVWFTWEADRPRLDVQPLTGATWQFPFLEGRRAIDTKQVTYSVWAADVENPSFDDLTLVGCFGDYVSVDELVGAVTVGRTYWVRVAPRGPAMFSIDPRGLAVDVRVEVVCDDRGSAVIEWIMTNPYAHAVDLTVRLNEWPRSIVKSATIAAASTETIRVSGRRDGAYSTEVVGAPVRIFGDDSVFHPFPVDVQCGDRANPIDVVGSCLAGRGRIDVYLTGSVRSRSAGVLVVGRSTLIERGLYADPDRIDRVSITGRRNGTYTVEVDPSARGAETQTFEIVIDCP